MSLSRDKPSYPVPSGQYNSFYREGSPEKGEDIMIVYVDTKD